MLKNYLETYQIKKCILPKVNFEKNNFYQSFFLIYSFPIKTL